MNFFSSIAKCFSFYEFKILIALQMTANDTAFTFVPVADSVLCYQFEKLIENCCKPKFFLHICFANESFLKVCNGIFATKIRVIVSPKCFADFSESMSHRVQILRPGKFKFNKIYVNKME